MQEIAPCFPCIRKLRKLIDIYFKRSERNTTVCQYIELKVAGIADGKIAIRRRDFVLKKPLWNIVEEIGESCVFHLYDGTSLNSGHREFFSDMIFIHLFIED